MPFQPHQDRLGGERDRRAGYAKGLSDGRDRIVIGVLPLKESGVGMCDRLSGPACFVAKVSAGAYGVALGRTDALKGALRRLWCIYSLIERIHSVLAAAGVRPAHGLRHAG
jgi:hypothetical protein